MILLISNMRNLEITCKKNRVECSLMMMMRKRLHLLSRTRKVLSRRRSYPKIMPRIQGDIPSISRVEALAIDYLISGDLTDARNLAERVTASSGQILQRDDKCVCRIHSCKCRVNKSDLLSLINREMKIFKCARLVKKYRIY